MTPVTRPPMELPPSQFHTMEGEEDRAVIWYAGEHSCRWRCWRCKWWWEADLEACKLCTLARGPLPCPDCLRLGRCERCPS